MLFQGIQISGSWELTLNIRSITMHPSPKRQSASLVWWRFWKTLTKVSKNPAVDIWRPRRLLSWDTAMMTEVAEVKPIVTGMDMKSTRTPETRISSWNWGETVINGNDGVGILKAGGIPRWESERIL